MPSKIKRCLSILEQSTLAFLNFAQVEKLLEVLIKRIALEFKIKKIFLLVPEEKVGNVQKYVIKTAYGQRLEFLKKDFALPLSEEASLFLTKKKNLILPLSKSSSKLPKSLKDTISQLEKLQARLIIPLTYRQHLVGLLILDTEHPWTKFDREEKILLQALFGQLAIALENNRLYTEAVTDSLTELYNHKFFQKRLGEEIERSQRYHHPLSLLMIDVDKFKSINDRYGHQAGDRVLKSIADALRFNVRLVDMPARYGGEEFVVILPETPSAGAKIAAERLRRLVENSVKMDRIKVTISIGISSYEKSNVQINAEQLIKQADEQLYKAKYEGRNKVCAA